MSSIEVVIKDRIYIPCKNVDEDILKHRYMKQTYNESKCEKCPYLAERHSDVCDECPANLGVYKLYNEKKINGKKHYGISVGNKNKWRKILKDDSVKIKVIDKRSTPKFRYKIKFVGKLRDYQEPAKKPLVKYNNGILIAPARSGKTVMTTYAVVKKKMRTIIMASQYDWLEQFYSTIMGNEKENEKAFTNIPELEEKTGKKICVLMKDGESIKKYEDADIILCTYQRFMSKKGQKELKYVRDKFGTLLVDEGDVTPARMFTKIINEFRVRSRLACTATHKRKDGMHFILDHIFGPIIHTVKVKSLKPEVIMIETGYTNKHHYKIFPYACRALAINKKRNELIVDWVMKDVNDGRSIVIPTTTVNHVKTLVNMINKRYGKTIACGFTAETAKTKERRTEIKRFAKNGKYKVIVGIRKMIQRGINVPIWSTIYNVQPISNPPNYQQETFRILTPLENKPKPIIRHFIDNFGISRGCLTTCVYKTYVEHGFKIERTAWGLINKYISKQEITPNITTPRGTITPKKKRLKGNLI